MSVLEWLVVAAAVLLVAVWVVLVPRMWQNRWEGLPEEPPEIWPYGRALWKGMLRAAAVAGPFLLIGVAAMLSERIEFGKPFEAVLNVVVLVLTPIVVVIAWTVILFNWPKQIVPPHMRSEPGAIRVWISSRRSRREALDGR